MRYVVVDLGGTNVRVGLAGSHARPGFRFQEPTAVKEGPEGIADQIARLVKSSLTAADLELGSMRRMVVGTPGPLDEERGLVVGPPNLPGWGEVPLAAMLAERCGIPAILVNDASVAALGEYVLGAGKGARTLVYLTVSTGIGGGVVADGHLLRGTSGNGAEIGHMVIDPHGPKCGCGTHGCLESMASGTAIARRIRELIEAGEPTVLSEQGSRGPVTAADVARAALAGDNLTLRVFNEAAEALGIGVSNCVNIFNPDVVAIGGGVTGAGALLFDTVRRVVDRCALPFNRNNVRIVPAELGDDSGLIGAAALAAREDVL